MKTTLACLSFYLTSVAAFSSQSRAFNPTKSSSTKLDAAVNRRSIVQTLSVASLGFLLNGPANASLLDDFGTDPVKIRDPAAAAAEVARKAAVAQPKAASNLEPNLRSNYYYPTNKKRYLPRIKKCNDAIPLAAESIGNNDWEAVNEFVSKIADDTILPMKLYTSSLTGGGTNVKVSFTKDMMKDADDFEKNQKALVKAVKKKDQPSASSALEGMATALLAYRTTGKLLGPDGGGDIPSVDEIRRSACRVQGRSFERKIQERDARLKSGS